MQGMGGGIKEFKKKQFKVKKFGIKKQRTIGGVAKGLVSFHNHPPSGGMGGMGM